MRLGVVINARNELTSRDRNYYSPEISTICSLPPSIFSIFRYPALQTKNLQVSYSIEIFEILNRARGTDFQVGGLMRTR